MCFAQGPHTSETLDQSQNLGPSSLALLPLLNKSLTLLHPTNI